MLAPSAELLATLTVPAVTVVVPEYVLTPDSDNVPESSFVRFAEPETIPEIVPVAPLATWIVESVDIATVPESSPDPVNRSAPFDDDPVPAMVSGSATTTAPTDSVPPVCTVVAPDVAPRESTLEMAITPPLIVVDPVKVLAADSVRVPVEDFTRAPPPEMIPDRVWFVLEPTVSVVDVPSEIVPE